jgi:hypothetical protein
MRFRGDDRGAAVQIGAVLLLGFLVIALSMYQATVVPAENKQVEFRHNERVQHDLQQVRNAIVGAGLDGDGRPVAVELGTQYPSRAVFVNPGPPSGSLRTDPLGTTTIENAAHAKPDGTVDDASETHDFWDGSPRDYETTALRYAPNYDRYQTAPTTVYENTLVYNELPGGNVTITDQTLVDGSRLSIVTLDGELSRSSSRTLSVDPRGVSVSTRVVPVTDQGGPVTVTLATGLDHRTWREILTDAGEYDGDGCTDDDDDGYVCQVTDAGDGKVAFAFEEGTTYYLELAKVGVGTGVDRTTPAYTTVTDPVGPVYTDQYGTTVVETRDKYNNPTPTVLNPSVDSGTLRYLNTEAPGRFRFEYEAPSDAETDRLRYSYESLDSFDADTPEDALDAVIVQSGGGSGTPGGSSKVRIDDVTINENPGAGKVKVDVAVSASDADGDDDLTAIRVELLDTTTNTVDAQDQKTFGPTGSATRNFNNLKTDDDGHDYAVRVTARDDDGNEDVKEYAL